jgi:adenosylhomocysteine nucleosidase
MPIVRTWLVVAAEKRELEFVFAGCDRSPNVEPLPLVAAHWAAEFACEVEFNGDRWILVANGPGAKLATEPFVKRMDVDGIISTGFCGALDPALQVGDIVREIHTIDRVAVTAAEKRELRESTGAAAVDMESAALAEKAGEWGVPFHVIRAVSDRADEDMPLDFNSYRGPDGRFSRSRIALAALASPFSRVPALLRLDRNCRIAARSLGDYFAHCRL